MDRDDFKGTWGAPERGLCSESPNCWVPQDRKWKIPGAILANYSLGGAYLQTGSTCAVPMHRSSLQ